MRHNKRLHIIEGQMLTSCISLQYTETILNSQQYGFIILVCLRKKRQRYLIGDRVPKISKTADSLSCL